MLTFEEKKAVFDGFSELRAVPVSLQRINYHFDESAVEKTIVVRYLHPNGNAFVYAGYLPKEETKDGYVSVREASAEEIKQLVDKAIAHLRKTKDGYEEGYQELWISEKGEKLFLRYDNPMWLIVLENNQIETVFKTKEAAEGYLMDEGFFEAAIK
ncbi:hypothetical protein [Pisciglobus halotolerans]|uniref:Uncharacterized protein n=1 Tax=Pisciglobus halotolerans TaxID=745365 RepID=A0A1I3BAK1_9LACT|nr:hypothetical protein [Pisciglobus halotolerans]SFH59323.1 hypothetical protein SAMN04489868_10532 [Pisciglobus halotolerans]